MPTTHQEGVAFAGQHLLFDFHGVSKHLDNPVHLQEVCEQAARATGATVLGSHFHHFGAAMGVSGVVLLAESHLSVHTWPEWGLATFDVFVCGQCRPQPAVTVLSDHLQPTRSVLWGHLRGELQ